MYNFKNRSIAGSAALIATVLTIAAATPLRAETRQVAVAYGDLDIHSQAGATELRARLRQAARRVCPSDGPSVAGEAARCRREALDRAEAKLAMKLAAPGVMLASR